MRDKIAALLAILTENKIVTDEPDLESIPEEDNAAQLFKQES